MATPGYPQMPMGGPPMGGHGGPPMGGPPMGGPPMGPPGMQRPIRRGTSKAVPIVVSAGLAVGVFCGLLFGVGKKNEAVAASPSGTNGKTDAESKPAGLGAAPAGLGASTDKPAAAGSATTPAAATAAGSATAPAAGSAATASAGSAAPAAGSAAAPAVATVKLTVTLKPEAAMKDAKLYIDGKVAEGMTVEVPADKKTVKIEVKSSGYRSVEKKVDVSGGQDMAIEFETAKKSSGGGTPTVRPPKRPDKPPGGGGGLIDI